MRAIPILRIFDEGKAREFYIDYLGFTIDWEHRFETGTPLYMQISRDDMKIHLSEHHGDACPGATIFVMMEGIDALHAELTAKSYKYYRPAVEQAPWNAKVMQITDPFGNNLRFNEDKNEA